MMRFNTNLLAAVVAASALTSPVRAEVVYDSLGTAATAGYSELNANSPIFGDSITLASGGRLTAVGASLYNSSSGGNTGPILTGTMALKIYDNTIPYAEGVLAQPLLGSANVTWDFGVGGLPAGYYAVDTFDLSALNLMLPQEILITQQFTQTQGTSLRNGFVLFNNSPVGSSPNSVYIKSATTAEGLHTFLGNPGQVGYKVEVESTVPDMGTTLYMLSAVFGLLPIARRFR